MTKPLVTLFREVSSRKMNFGNWQFETVNRKTLVQAMCLGSSCNLLPMVRKCNAITPGKDDNQETRPTYKSTILSPPCTMPERNAEPAAHRLARSRKHCPTWERWWAAAGPSARPRLLFPNCCWGLWQSPAPSFAEQSRPPACHTSCSRALSATAKGRASPLNREPPTAQSSPGLRPRSTGRSLPSLPCSSLSSTSPACFSPGLSSRQLVHPGTDSGTSADLTCA